MSMHKYKAYQHVNFLLINGCDTRKNNICGHFFLKVALVSSSKYYNSYQKSKQTSVQKILYFNRDHSNKSCETRAVIFTCR